MLAAGTPLTLHCTPSFCPSLFLRPNPHATLRHARRNLTRAQRVAVHTDGGRDAADERHEAACGGHAHATVPHRLEAGGLQEGGPRCGRARGAGGTSRRQGGTVGEQADQAALNGALSPSAAGERQATRAPPALLPLDDCHGSPPPTDAARPQRRWSTRRLPTRLHCTAAAERTHLQCPAQKLL